MSHHDRHVHQSCVATVFLAPWHRFGLLQAHEYQALGMGCRESLAPVPTLRQTRLRPPVVLQPPRRGGEERDATANLRNDHPPSSERKWVVRLRLGSVPAKTARVTAHLSPGRLPLALPTPRRSVFGCAMYYNLNLMGRSARDPTTTISRPDESTGARQRNDPWPMPTGQKEGSLRESEDCTKNCLGRRSHRSPGGAEKGEEGGASFADLQLVRRAEEEGPTANFTPMPRGSETVVPTRHPIVRGARNAGARSELGESCA